MLVNITPSRGGQEAISHRGERILRRKAPQDDQGNLPKYCVILRRSRRIRFSFECTAGSSGNVIGRSLIAPTIRFICSRFT